MIPSGGLSDTGLAGNNEVNLLMDPGFNMV